MKRIRFAATTLLALMMSTGALAGVIDFEDVANDTISNSQSSDGFNFSGNNGGALYTTAGVDCTPACVSDGTRALVAGGLLFGLSDQVTMTATGGGAFVLASVDVGGLLAGDNPGFDAAQVDYTELDNGVIDGSGVMTLVDDANGVAQFQTFAIPGVPVTEVIFTGVGNAIGNNGFSLDNIDVATTPEPASIALLGLGLLMLACLRRRA